MAPRLLTLLNFILLGSFPMSHGSTSQILYVHILTILWLFLQFLKHSTYHHHRNSRLWHKQLPIVALKFGFTGSLRLLLSRAQSMTFGSLASQPWIMLTSRPLLASWRDTSPVPLCAARRPSNPEWFHITFSASAIRRFLVIADNITEFAHPHYLVTNPSGGCLAELPRLVSYQSR